ncbi:MAG TPA: DUF488 family protein [Patescibacteria group bacterium]
MIKIKRAYEPVDSENDGYRILVDRIWPRGIKKQNAEINIWLKDAAPTAYLRKWFGHEPEKWEEFKKRYKSELEEKMNLINDIKKMENEYGTITLVYGSKDESHNQAVVLKEVLNNS